MSETIGNSLVLEGPALEDARQVIDWGLRFTAGFFGGGCEITPASLGYSLEELAGRAHLAEQLGEPGEPTFEATGVALGPASLAILAEAAEQHARMSAAFAGDLDATPAVAAFWEARLEVLRRVLLLVEPPPWSSS